MKQLLSIIILAVVGLSVKAQTKDSTGVHFAPAVSAPITEWIAKDGGIKTTTGEYSWIIQNKGDEIINLHGNGDLYFLPSAFCKCDSCKKFKGMKLYGNIYHP